MAKLADKYAIGTEHVIGGKTVVVEKSVFPPCKGCAFLQTRKYQCILPLDLQGTNTVSHFPVCDSLERSDKTDVIFKLKGGQQ